MRYHVDRWFNPDLYHNDTLIRNPAVTRELHPIIRKEEGEADKKVVTAYTHRTGYDREKPLSFGAALSIPDFFRRVDAPM